MTDQSLSDRIVKAPVVYDRGAADRLRVGLGERFGALPDKARELIYAVGGASPFLTRLFIRHPEYLFQTLQGSPEAAMALAIKEAWNAGDAGSGDTARLLRHAKARASMVTGLGEISGAWSVIQAMKHWSAFADACAGAALRSALRGLEAKGFSPVDAAAPEAQSGIVMLAMGKLGGHELNYSSDIDLVALYDPDSPALAATGDPRGLAVRATRRMAALLQDQTPDGYVFRTDLRLRPDPGVTALAVSIGAAERYYEGFGQNWERAAFIKARPVAGELALGEDFIKTLRPFIWRKFLDFAAIEDVHKVLHQIHSAKGGDDIAFAGHDLKTGAGGIREIEFFVQAQQLILGGKNSALRSASTLQALADLSAAGHIAPSTASAMHESYLVLREVEHRLQMINDEQTHALPKDADGASRLAAFLDEADGGSLEAKLRRTFQTVHTHAAAFFERSKELADAAPPMSFTGVENDGATLEALRDLGFGRAEEISDAIRNWRAGRLRATRTARAVGLLESFTPHLLMALSRAIDPDAAFFAFASFLAKLPSGVQIFSLFKANPALLDRLVQIVSLSPFLAKELPQRVNFIESLLDDKWQGADEASGLREAVEGLDLEDALNEVRRRVGEAKFQTAAQMLSGEMTPHEAALAFAAAADDSINALAPVIRAAFAAQHGAIESELAIIGLGRFGAGEMTAASDLDIVFIYDGEMDAVSDGDKPLDLVTYSTRLVRRFVTALSATTEEGALYEVDMQLRPSGRAGPAAVSFNAFSKYYDEDAWLWEVMALTKARVVCGDQRLRDKVRAELDRILARRRDADNVTKAVVEMRARLRAAKPGRSVWDVKNIEGGMTDIGFICQRALLLAGVALGPMANAGALKELGARKLLTSKNAAFLLTTNEIFDSILQVSRAATGAVFNPETAGEALSSRMVQACGVNSISEAEEVLRTRQAQVNKIFEEETKRRML